MFYILLNSMPIDVLGVRCRKGSKQREQQSPQQQGGLHGNLATVYLQASVDTTLYVLWKLYTP